MLNADFSATSLWSGLLGRPSLFPPAAHTQALSTILSSDAAVGDVPIWDGTKFVPGAVSGGGGGGSLVGYTGATTIKTLGVITTGTWRASPIDDAFISSAATWNAKQPPGLYITSLTGDVVAAGPGAAAAVLGSSINFTGKTLTGGTHSTATLSGTFNGTVGATTPSTGAFTDLTASGTLGVGTTTPSYSVDVTKSAASLRVFDTRASGGAFIVSTSFSLGDVALSSTGALYVSAGGTLLGYFNSTGLNNMAIGAFAPAAGTFKTLNTIDSQPGAFADTIFENTGAAGYTRLKLVAHGLTSQLFYQPGVTMTMLSPDSKIELAPNGTVRFTVTSTGINLTSIGVTTPADGHFTTLAASSTLTVTGTASCASLSTASIFAETGAGSNAIIARFNSSNQRGGIYVAGTSGQPFIGGNLTFSSGNVFNYDRSAVAWALGDASGGNVLGFWVVASGTAGSSAIDFSTTTQRIGYMTPTGLNAMAIGASVASTGSFTTLNATGSATFQNDVNLNRAAGTNYLYYSSDLAIAKNGTGNALAFDTSRNATFTGSIGNLSGNMVLAPANGVVTVSSSAAFTPQYIQANSTADTSAAYQIFQKSRSSGVITALDALGTLLFQGHDGTTFRNAATIWARGNTVGSGYVKGRLYLETMDGAGASAARAYVDSDSMVTTVPLTVAGTIGTSSASTVRFNASGTVSGATTCYGFLDQGIIGSGVTSTYYGFVSAPSTAAAAFTTALLHHFEARDVALGAGSALTSQYGFFCNDLTAGSSNVGIYSGVSSGATKWNLYIGGTAKNYIKGDVQIDGTLSGAAASFSGVIAGTGGQISLYGFGGFATKSAIYQNNAGTTYIYHDGTNTVHRVLGTDTLTVKTTGLDVLGTLTATAIENTPIGAATPSTGKFTTLESTGDTTVGGQLIAKAGTGASPSITFVGTTNTGFYKEATGSIGIALSGSGVGKINGAGMSLATTQYFAAGTFKAFNGGSAAAAIFYYASNFGSGMYFPAANDVGISANGTERIRLNSAGVGIGGVPTRPFHIIDTGTTNESLLIENTGVAAGYTQIVLKGTGRSWQMGVGNASETSFGVASKWYLYDAAASLMRMVMDTAGLLTVPGGIAAALTGNVTGNVSGSSGSCTGNAATATTASACSGNAATATKLQTARAINGTNFDGSAAISISATAAGTGAVARTINSRASDVFNVKDYGAVGDGATNDTAAVQAAADALKVAGRGTLYFPDGRYWIYGQITLGDGRSYTGYSANFTLKGEGVNSSVVIQKTNNASSPLFYVNVDNGGGGAAAKCEVYELGFRTASGVECSAAVTVNCNVGGSSEYVGPISIHDVDIGFDPPVGGGGGSGGWVYGIRVLNPWKVILHNITGAGTNDDTIKAVGGSCGDGSNGSGSGALIELVGGINVMMSNIYASFFQQGIRARPYTSGVSPAGLGAQGYNISNFQTVAVIESMHVYAGVAISAINLSNFLFDQGNSVNNSLANYGVIVDCTEPTYPNIRGQVVVMNGNVTMASGSTGAVFLFQNVSQAVVSGVINYTANGLFAHFTNSCNKCQLMNNEMGGAPITVDAGCSYVYVNNTQSAGTLTGFGGTVVNLATPF